MLKTHTNYHIGGAAIFVSQAHGRFTAPKARDVCGGCEGCVQPKQPAGMTRQTVRGTGQIGHGDFLCQGRLDVVLHAPHGQNLFHHFFIPTRSVYKNNPLSGGQIGIYNL